MPAMEPYRIKMVEPIPFPTPAERRQAFVRAGYNAFNLPADVVTIDLLSDSGTGATSSRQDAAAVLSDASYAGRSSWFAFRDAVRDLTGYPHILPVHQGRAAERILFSALLGPGKISISNTHFDTTRFNVAATGATALDLPCPESADMDSAYPFKGNIDLDTLATTLAGPDGPKVAFVLMTVTNNGGGGQPVSMANLRATRDLCHRNQVPLFLDAARFAENAWLVTQREPGYQHRTPKEVASLAFSMSDGCTASLKKDGITAEGAFIGLRDPKLARQCEIQLIGTEGHLTYGGLGGHDLARLAQGLREVVDPRYLRARADHTAHLARLVNDAGVAMVQPPGIHALYLNAARLLPHLPPSQFPGHALACQLYLEGGIRCSEVGSLYLGSIDDNFDLTIPAPFELVRLAIPRRVYTQSHLEYVAGVIAEIAKAPERVPGYRILDADPFLRPFTVVMAPLAV